MRAGIIVKTGIAPIETPTSCFSISALGGEEVISYARIFAVSGSTMMDKNIFFIEIFFFD
ncbi:MAG: hypothetical protein LBU51_09075 [Bacteroidales bacterium]|nr:hypothetical protein [Bacteroidales bacterium]